MTCFQCRFFLPEKYSRNYKKVPSKCGRAREEFAHYGKNCEVFEYEPGTWRES